MTEILARPSDQPSQSSGRSHQELPRFKRGSLKNDLPELTELQPWKSLLAIACEWSIIIAMIAMALHFNHWLAYVIAIIVIGTRQHALGVLMHDASHYRILRNKFWNDLISDLFLAYPMGVSTASYRYEHLEHHRYTSTERDQGWKLLHRGPFWYWPKTRRNGIKTVFTTLIGLQAFRLPVVFELWSPWRYFFNKPGGSGLYIPWYNKILLIATYTAFFTFLTVYHYWDMFLLLWIVPEMTVLFTILNLRGAAEHLATPMKTELSLSRTVIPKHWLETLLIAPWSVHYHTEHHLFPSVPFYNLKKLHQRLMQEEEFRNQAHVSHGYRKVFRELTSVPA